jgi:hypothetical protein
LATASLRGLEILESTAFGNLLENIKHFQENLYIDHAEFELSTDSGSPIVVVRSKSETYERRVMQLKSLKNGANSAGFDISLCKGTRMEMKSKFFPFCRIIINSNMSKEQIVGLCKILSTKKDNKC